MGQDSLIDLLLVEPSAGMVHKAKPAALEIKLDAKGNVSIPEATAEPANEQAVNLPLICCMLLAYPCACSWAVIGFVDLLGNRGLCHAWFVRHIGAVGSRACCCG